MKMKPSQVSEPSQIKKKHNHFKIGISFAFVLSMERVINIYVLVVFASF